MIHDDKPTLEAALEHHGVKGQKWGVRRATALTDRQIKIHKSFRDGKSPNKVDTAIVKTLSAPDRAAFALLGKGKYEAYQNKKISELERSKERIANGELIARTLIFGPQYSKK